MPEGTIPPAGPPLWNRMEAFADRIADAQLIRNLRVASAALAAGGLAVLAINDATERPAGVEASPCIAECLDPTILESTTTTSQQPITEVLGLQKLALPEIEPIPGIDIEVDHQMRAVELSPQGFLSFVDRMNTDAIPHTLQIGEFNPTLNKKPQGPTHKVMLHYTAYYANNGGISQEAIGGVDILEFANSIARRYGSVMQPGGSPCCGSNLLVDRDANGYLMTAMSTKVQHNPPNDTNSFALDVEAKNMKDIKTKQYEGMMYSALTVLLHEGLIDKPLAETIEGHAEDRERRRQLIRSAMTGKHTEDQIVDFLRRNAPAKYDFTNAESELFRRLLQRFIDAHPWIKTAELRPLP